jgi:hypothetical protein
LINWLWAISITEGASRRDAITIESLRARS